MIKLSFFRKQQALHPELCFITSCAVGFHATVYWTSRLILDSEKDQYHMRPWDPFKCPEIKFCDWYEETKDRFFDTPEQAAASFVEAWHEWQTMKG